MSTPPYPGPPRWVRWFGFAAAALVMVVVLLHLTGYAPVGHG